MAFTRAGSIKSSVGAEDDADGIVSGIQRVQVILDQGEPEERARVVADDWAALQQGYAGP